jgi:hypothetical protein
MDLLNVFPISLQDFEEGDEALRIAKTNRTTVEYYFTCTPSLPLYIFNHFMEINSLTYLDSDFFFFSDPEPVMEVIGEHSIAITSHRFPSALRKLEKQYGVFNVGWLTFKRNEQAMSCLKRWREQCLEWCFDRLEEGRFADQMYLDEWPKFYPDTIVISHKGVNLAPCNIGNYKISVNNGKVMVDGNPLVCYHFFGLKDFYGFLYYLSLRRYGFEPTHTILEHIYEPYFQALAKGKKQAVKVIGGVLKTSSTRGFTRIKPINDRYSYLKQIGKVLIRYKVASVAILSRRFVLFFNNRVIFKFITCGLGRNEKHRQNSIQC